MKTFKGVDFEPIDFERAKWLVVDLIADAQGVAESCIRVLEFAHKNLGTWGFDKCEDAESEKVIYLMFEQLEAVCKAHGYKLTGEDTPLDCLVRERRALELKLLNE